MDAASSLQRTIQVRLVLTVLRLPVTIIWTAPPTGNSSRHPASYIGQIVVATDGPYAQISNTQVVSNNLHGSELPGIVVHSNVLGDVLTHTLIQNN